MSKTNETVKPSTGRTDAAKADDNLSIWNQVRTPDPKFTKGFRRGGGFSGTATNATYLFKLATEVFGPIGHGWGYELVSSEFIQGHLIGPQDTPHPTRWTVHIVLVRVWYLHNGEQHWIGPQFGQTDFVYANKYGLQTDEEAPKKSITDAITKCLSMLGFAADIHMGLFDDNKYVNDARNMEDASTAPVEEKPKEKTETPPTQAEVEQTVDHLRAAIEAASQERVDQYVGELRHHYATFIRLSQKRLADMVASWMTEAQKTVLATDGLTWPATAKKPQPK